MISLRDSQWLITKHLFIFFFNRNRTDQSGQSSEQTVRRSRHVKINNVSLKLLPEQIKVYSRKSHFQKTKSSKTSRNSMNAHIAHADNDSLLHSEQQQVNMPQNVIQLDDPDNNMPIYTSSQIIDAVCPHSYVAAIPLQPVFSTSPFPATTSTDVSSSYQVNALTHPLSFMNYIEFQRNHEQPEPYQPDANSNSTSASQQNNIQEQLERKHDELQTMIVYQQEELRRVSEQLSMARFGMVPSWVSVSLPLNVIAQNASHISSSTMSEMPSGSMDINVLAAQTANQPQYDATTTEDQSAFGSHVSHSLVTSSGQQTNDYQTQPTYDEHIGHQQLSAPQQQHFHRNYTHSASSMTGVAPSNMATRMEYEIRDNGSDSNAITVYPQNSI